MKNDFINKFREDTASIWTLLNDTSIFLTRVKKFHEYENDIREWRARLQSYQHNAEVKKEIKQNIIDLRISLRQQGFDLKLGSKDIQVFGFKSDDAPLEGYRRLVVVIDKERNDIYSISGNENHLELMKFLSLRLGVDSLYVFNGVHNLWYRWCDNILQINGADSEGKEDLEEFRIYVENNKNLLLKKLRNLM